MHSPLTTTWRILQYPIGLTVAAFVSVFAAFLFASAGMMMHVIVGFVGVFVGSLFFLPDSRRIGAIFLSLMGIAFFYVRFVYYDLGRAGLPDSKLRLALITIGAIIAVITTQVWHSRSMKSDDDNAA